MAVPFDAGNQFYGGRPRREAVCSTAVLSAAASKLALAGCIFAAVMSEDGSMVNFDCIRRGVAGSCVAVALVGMAVTAPARADDANPLVDLVDAATQRLQTAEPVAATKWINGGSIEDPQRVQQVLDAVASDATGRGIDPGLVRQAFTDQIHATEAIEYTRFAQWKLDPESAPRVAPDLAASRAAIDRLNTEMVSQAATHWPVLHSPGCAETLADARATVTNARSLDALYQQALAFSTHPYCAP
jgi:chorismate mutase